MDALMFIGSPQNIPPATKRLKRRATLRCRALFFCLAFLFPPCAACAYQPSINRAQTDRPLSDRLVAVACHLYAEVTAGRMDTATYTYFQGLRSDAMELVVRADAGTGDGFAALCAVVVCERAVYGEAK